MLKDFTTNTNLQPNEFIRKLSLWLYESLHSMDQKHKVFWGLQALPKVDAADPIATAAVVATGDGADQMDADAADEVDAVRPTDMVDKMDYNQLADNLLELNRPAPAFRTGAQGRPNPAGEAQAGPRQKDRSQSSRWFDIDDH